MAGSRNIKHNPIVWSMWANVLAVFGGLFMIVGGAISQLDFERSDIGAAVLGVGVFVILFEWPRGKRERGWTIPRAYQHQIQPFVSFFGPIGRNLFFRAVVWLVASVMCFFSFPCILGGVTLALAAFVYFIAAFKGESWRPLDPPRKKASGPALNQAPSKPPPRLVSAPTEPPPRNVKMAYVENDSARPAVRSQVDARARTISEAPNRPVPVPTAAPTRSVPVPTAAPTRPVPVPASRGGSGGAAVQPKPRPKPRSAGGGAAAAKFKDYPWESATDPSTGDTYYINNETDETTWDKPAQWDEVCPAQDDTSSPTKRTAKKHCTAQEKKETRETA